MREGVVTPKPGSQDWDDNPTDYVEVPWQLMRDYLDRARTNGLKVPADQRLEWVRSRDEVERSKWQEISRLSKDSLGKVINKIFHDRNT